MEIYIKELAKTNLFSGICPEDIAGLIKCIDARLVEYPKGTCVIREGDSVSDFGVMLFGHGRAFKEDAAGRLIIITLLKKGSELGVLLSAGSGCKSPVSVQTDEDSVVLMIPFDRLITRCKRACPHHEALIRNYIGIVAKKGLILHERIDCLLKSTVREKILAYLARISRETESSVFSIPLDRNGMAEYLNVERSALSRELSRMKRAGLIDYHKNSFKLLNETPGQQKCTQ